MRSVVRNPNKEVCFVIDEANAIGRHSEIETAMGATQAWVCISGPSFRFIADRSKKKWQTFIANSSVRHFFNISDNMSAEYLKKMFGTTSIPTYDDKGRISGATARPLVTADEIRRTSGQTIYTVIDQLAPAQVSKQPYFDMGLEADPNPYYKPMPPGDTESGVPPYQPGQQNDTVWRK